MEEIGGSDLMNP